MVAADAALAICFVRASAFVLGRCPRSNIERRAPCPRARRQRAHRRERREFFHGHAAAGLLGRLGGARAIPVCVVDRTIIPDQPFGCVQPYPLGGAGDGDVEGRSAEKYRGEQAVILGDVRIA